MTDEMIVLKTASCPTVTGSGRLEYALGQDARGKLYFRIVKNAGGGHYSQEWVAWDDILAALEPVEPITALPLRELYSGKSVNTPGFLLAALVQEKLLVRLPDKTRHYALQDPTAWLDKIRQLQGTKSKPTAAKEPAKKTAEKTPQAPAKKIPAKKATTRSTK